LLGTFAARLTLLAAAPRELGAVAKHATVALTRLHGVTITCGDARDRLGSGANGSGGGNKMVDTRAEQSDVDRVERAYAHSRVADESAKKTKNKKK
jgi:hypothetical protein